MLSYFRFTAKSFVKQALQITTKKKKGKDRISPPNDFECSSNVPGDIRAFFLTPLRAAMTVEAALVLPLFLFCMTALIQYGSVMGTAVQIGTALTETGKSMATAAYAMKYGGEGSAPGLGVSALSAGYAHHKVIGRAGNTDRIKNVNMALSSFLQEEEQIDLVRTYQIKTPVAVIKLPGNFFLQRACVRAWTGRGAQGGDGSGTGNENGQGEVYVTESGRVYHEDPECSYLNPSIREVDEDAIGGLRNRSGEKYRPCESCGGGSGTVYITDEGNRYHRSIDCSGLKRTIHTEEKGSCGLRPCSKCSGG